jgi:ribosomal protein S19
MIDRLKAEKHENIESKFIHKTTVRSSTIMPTFEKIDCMLYNGIIWKKIKITSNMFYNKMGSFNYTRKLPKHKDKNKKL